MIRWLKAECRRRARVEWFGRALAIAREEKRQWVKRFENGMRIGYCSLAFHCGYWTIAKKREGKWFVIGRTCLSVVAIKVAKDFGSTP